jgi:hypothetical protein
MVKGRENRKFGSLPFSASVAMMDLHPLEERVEDIHDRVLGDAVAKGRGRNAALLGVDDGEKSVGARRVAARKQGVANRAKIGFDIAAKVEAVEGQGLGAAGLDESELEIVEVGDRFDQMADGFHLKRSA